MSGGSSDAPGVGPDRARAYRRERERSGPLRALTKFLYAWGEMPGSHMNFAIGVFLLLYYNQILGVSATAVSIAAGVALFLDAISDPLIGAYSDRFRSRLGRRHPFMYAAAIPLGVFICLLFLPPAGLSEGWLIAWMACFLILTRLTFTVFSVPWSALLPELAVRYEDRTSLAAYRPLVANIFGGLFGMLVFRFVFPASDAYPQGQLNPDFYPLFAFLVGSLMTVWCLLTTHFTRREIPYLLQPVEASRPGIAQMFAEVIAALKNRNYRLLLAAMLVYFGIVSTLAVFDMLVNTYFWKLAGEQLSFLGLFGIIGPVLGFLLAPRIQPYFQKQHILCFGLLTQMILSLVVVSARLGGYFPDNDSTWFLPLLATLTATQAFIQVLGVIALLSMMADLVDEQELQTGQRQEGVFASGIALATKAIGSVGVVVGGLLVDHFIGLQPGSAATEVGEDVIFRLAIADAVIVNLFIVVPAYLISRYNLSSARVAVIQRDLAERRAAMEAEPT
ncbi:MAG: MFS transporter [Pseudomonadota bacterium]